jgi:hypothetical protein
MVMEQADHDWEKTSSWVWKIVKDAVEEARQDPDREMFDHFPSDQVLVTHAHVYALAEKYNILGLKAYAFKRFIGYYNDATIDALTSVGLHDALEVVFDTTPESDKDLRATALKILENNLKKMACILVSRISSTTFRR